MVAKTVAVAVDGFETDFKGFTTMVESYNTTVVEPYNALTESYTAIVKVYTAIAEGYTAVVEARTATAEGCAVVAEAYTAVAGRATERLSRPAPQLPMGYTAVVEPYTALADGVHRGWRGLHRKCIEPALICVLAFRLHAPSSEEALFSHPRPVQTAHPSKQSSPCRRGASDGAPNTCRFPSYVPHGRICPCRSPHPICPLDSNYIFLFGCRYLLPWLAY